MVRALTRVEWLRVLARGFHGECQIADRTWQQAELEELFERLGRESSRPRDRSQVADGPAGRLLLHAERRSPRLPGQGGGPQRAVEPLSAERRGLRGRGRRAVLEQLAIADQPVHPHQQLPRAASRWRPRPGDLHPLGRRALPAGQPAGEGPRAAHLEVLLPRRLAGLPPPRARTAGSCWSTAPAAATATRTWRPSRPACSSW